MLHLKASKHYLMDCEILLEQIMETINYASLADVYAMSDVELFDSLDKNVNFRNLKKEFIGKFNCDYLVNGWFVQISNHTDSWISVHLHPFDFSTEGERERFYIASAFALRVEVLLNRKMFSNQNKSE